MTSYSFRIQGSTEATVISLSDTPFSETLFDSISPTYVRVTAMKVIDGLMLERLDIRHYQDYRWWIEVEAFDPLMGLWHLEIEDNYMEIRTVHSFEGDPYYDGEIEITISLHDAPQVDVNGNPETTRED